MNKRLGLNLSEALALQKGLLIQRDDLLQALRENERRGIELDGRIAYIKEVLAELKTEEKTDGTS